MRNESDSCLGQDCGQIPVFGVHDRPMVSSVDYESYSMSVRTRKMVNYA